MSKSNSINKKLQQYSKLADGIQKSIKPVTQKAMMASGMLLAALPSTEAAPVYSGIQNLDVSATGAFVHIDIDGGGNDMRFRFNAGPANLFFYRSGNLDQFIKAAGGGTVYAAALATNAPICPGDANLTNNSYASMSFNGSGPWGALGAGDQRSVGIQLSGNRFGWVRVEKKASNTGFIIVDWAYESTAATCMNAGALPVELAGFSVKKSKQDVHLSWETLSESHNAGFEVQRSNDGKEFTTIGWVEGAGDADIRNTYEFDDKNLRTGAKYYYRLKQVDIDGQFSMTEVLIVDFKGKDEIASEFFPNIISNNSSKISWNASIPGDIKLEVYNASGQIVMRDSKSVTVGEQTLDFDFSALDNGTFFVKLEGETTPVYRKIIVQK